MRIEILSAEILDNAVEVQDWINDEIENYLQPSGVSVLVEFAIDGKKYTLDYQTTTTSDNGAYSSRLFPYDGDDGTFNELANLFDDGIDDDGLFDLFNEIKEKSEAEKLWRDYIDENYIIDDAHFGGIDGNSEINKMRSREE